MRTLERQDEPLPFKLGDYLVGILTGAFTALAVCTIVGLNWDMIMAMPLEQPSSHRAPAQEQRTMQ